MFALLAGVIICSVVVCRLGSRTAHIPNEVLPMGFGVLGSFSLVMGILSAFVLSAFISSPALAQDSAADVADVEVKEVDEGESETTCQSGAEEADLNEPLHEPIGSGGVKRDPNRPQWVDVEEPIRNGDVHTMTVSAGPYPTEAQCRRELDEKLKVATDEYIAWWLESDLAPVLIRYQLSEIKTNVLPAKNIYDETITVSLGDMQYKHALLEFDSRFREEVKHEWREITAQNRLLQVGLFSGGMLCLLATAFGYFKMDTATKGYYTGRLQFLAAGAILATVVVGAVFARWINWI